MHTYMYMCKGLRVGLSPAILNSTSSSLVCQVESCTVGITVQPLFGAETYRTVQPPSGGERCRTCEPPLSLHWPATTNFYMPGRWRGRASKLQSRMQVGFQIVTRDPATSRRLYRGLDHIPYVRDLGQASSAS